MVCFPSIESEVRSNTDQHREDDVSESTVTYRGMVSCCKSSTESHELISFSETDSEWLAR